ncbi:S1C family serine protease (plasmid) [Embleya sp. NBC_00888]|uniref:S1C family serine protease n=1 Tax=Embleya sp. NBC_00888 TaxID=2975960 RepID=UPI002F914D7B|nr:S1C family serine protease [Embleya sp. NBC_00888]
MSIRSGPVSSGDEHAVPTIPPLPRVPPPEAGRHRPSGRRVRRASVALVAAAVAAGLLGGLAGATAVHRFGGSDGGSPAAIGAPARTAAVTDAAAPVAAVAAAVQPSVVELRVTTRRGSVTGSGLVLDTDGRILTNNHVLAGANAGTVTVAFADGRTAPAGVVAADSAHDLAVVRVTGVSGLTPATLGDSGSARVGDEVVAFGSPLGLTGTVTSGVISALDRRVTVSGDSAVGSSEDGSGSSTSPVATGAGNTLTYPAIQTDVAITSGSSGGPLVDLSGRVIGIDSAIYSAAPDTGTGTEAGSVGIGFAIPIDTVKTFLNTLPRDK